MTEIDIEKLATNNKNVDAKKLRERLEASKKLTKKKKYGYNLVAPFSGRLHRQSRAKQ